MTVDIPAGTPLYPLDDDEPQWDRPMVDVDGSEDVLVVADPTFVHGAFYWTVRFHDGEEYLVTLHDTTAHDGPAVMLPPRWHGIAGS